ncbi:MAG: hypothetical protein NVSMB19_24460 [Vulcanimicrobiaceae bacterium]
MNDNVVPNRKFRRPIAPGEMLRKEFLETLHVTPAAFATHIGIPLAELEAFIRGERALTTTLAIRIGNAVGTSVQMWLNMQMACDLYDAMQSPEGLAATHIAPLPEHLATLKPQP